MSDGEKKADGPKAVDLKPLDHEASQGEHTAHQPDHGSPPPHAAPGAERPGMTPSEIGPPDPADLRRAETSDPSQRPPGRGSEWTASDDRGPLGRAEDDEGPGTPAGDRDLVSTHALASESAGGPSEGHVPPVDATRPPAASVSDGSTSASPVAPVAATASAGAEPKRSLWPVAAALVLGALIGAGSAAFVYRGYADDSQPDPQVARLTSRVDALEKRPDSQSAVAALKTSVTALDGQVAAIRQGTTSPAASKPGTSTAPAASASQGAAAPATDLGPLNQKIATLQSSLDALKGSGADTKALQEKVAALEGTIAGMKSATDRAQAGVSSVESRQKEIAGKVTAPALAVVADSLVQQIDHGVPFATQVDALAALGADPARIAVLRQNAEKGVPSARTLAARFEPLALPIAATANKAPPNAGLVDRLKSGMFSLVSVRRADDTSGTDLPSRVARIKAALAHDDVAGALEAWSALPADAKAKADAWAALAKTHADAMNAARALQHDSIVALSTKKS